MRGDGLRLARALEHEELGEDRRRLEENGEGPEQLGDREAVVEEQREHNAGAEQVLHAERVYRGVVCWPVQTVRGCRKNGGGWEWLRSASGIAQCAVNEGTHRYLYFMR